MSQPSPEQAPQVPVAQVATQIQRFLDLLGIPEEGDDGRCDDGRLG